VPVPVHVPVPAPVPVPVPVRHRICSIAVCFLMMQIYRIVLSPVVLCCVVWVLTWSLTSREVFREWFDGEDVWD